VQGEMLSIGDIGRLRRPAVWTLHDMWAFCGAEHYTDDQRWREGYDRRNRPAGERGPDLNRWVWARKRRRWTQPMQLVAPSRWLAECVQRSALMRDWPVTVIPYPIDIARWQPVERSAARALLGLPPDVPLVLFGAAGGTRDPRKGFDLLERAMPLVRETMHGVELVVYGQGQPRTAAQRPERIHYTGTLRDDLTLRLLYSAADVFVLPSRQDNLPNTGIEAMACGTPVVAFRTGGLGDIVDHQRTGYLAEAFDPADLACGIRWVMADAARHRALREAARAAAVSRFAAPVIARQYLDLYAGLS